MSAISKNHLDVTASERKKLRAAGIRVKEIHHHKPDELQSLLNIPRIRAAELYALSEFQSIPSIGIKFALDLISMGFYSLGQLKGKDGAKLTDQYELQKGAWIDPCVEDQFRLVVYYANHPGAHKNWWDFTKERKAFRESYGYPASRPAQPWFELPQYQVKSPAKRDLHNKLRKSIALMKKDPSRQLTLKELSEAAHMSSYHFLRRFRETYSQTPFQYLTHLRLKLSCKLLRKKSWPIQTVISNCGFKNDSSFIRLFKKEFKVTPAVYRKEPQ